MKVATGGLLLGFRISGLGFRMVWGFLGKQ